MTRNSWLLRLAFVAKQIHLKKKNLCFARATVTVDLQMTVMRNDNQTLWSCLHVVSESNQIGSFVMIDFLGILLEANEWFCEWWCRAFLAKLGTVSATWGFDGRELCLGIWPADSGTAWSLKQWYSPEDHTKSSLQIGLWKSEDNPFSSPSSLFLVAFPFIFGGMDGGGGEYSPSHSPFPNMKPMSNSIPLL